MPSKGAGWAGNWPPPRRTQPAEHSALQRVQPIEAGCEGPPQGSLPGPPGAFRGDVEGGPDQLDELGQAATGGLTGHQLQRQRQSVNPAGDLDQHLGGLAVVGHRHSPVGRPLHLVDPDRTRLIELRVAAQLELAELLLDQPRPENPTRPGYWPPP